MIYKNGTKANKIELIIDDDLICRVFLSDGKVFTGKPEKIIPGVMHSQIKLETLSVLTIAKTIEALSKEMDK